MTKYKVNRVLLQFLLLVCVYSCGENKSNATKEGIINVATAANVQFAMKEIEAAFEQKYGLNINII